MHFRILSQRGALLAAAVACALGIGAGNAVWAAPVVIVGGSGAPPATLGPYTLRSFPPDTRPIFARVETVDTPFDGFIGFDPPLSHRRIGTGWVTWSHGYKGDVYACTTGTVTLDLSRSVEGAAGPQAFLFYTAPGSDFGFFEATFVDSAGDSTSVKFNVFDTTFASWIGAYVEDDRQLRTVTVETGESLFAIGEFHMAPEPAGLLALLLLLHQRRR